MPGIAGFIGRDHHELDPACLRLMVQQMIHEPFHSQGDYANTRLGLSCGWVPTAGTSSDYLPAWNEQRDICLIFLGEEFSEREPIKTSTVRPHVVGDGKANYLLQLYEEFGPSFVERLNGSFSGLIMDLREQKVILFNDRYGLSRIYFHENDRGFYFASEAKSLLKVLPGLRRVDLKGLGEFFSCGCVLQNRTLFSGIALLPGGSAWTFARGQPLNKQTYFKAEIWEQQPALQASEYYEALKDTWKRILPRYFNGPAPIALSLTGGADSRMILAWAPLSAGTLPCYTFGGRYRNCADVTVARQLAGICRQKHETIPVGGEFLTRFPALAEKAVYLSDGTCDVTGSIDLYVQELARQIAPVRVTGTNGGEILRRLVAFKPAPGCPGMLGPELAHSVEAARQTYGQELEGHRLSFTAFKQAPWYLGPKFVLERSLLNLRMPYFDNDLVALAYRAPAELLNGHNNISLRLAAEGNPALANGSLPGVSRARHLFNQFTVKAEYAYDYGMPQWLAVFDHALAPLHLDRLFLGRHKFHHFRVYYRDELADYVKEILLDSRSRNRPYLNGNRLERIVNRHIEGSGNYTREIHKLLSVELLTRQLIEQN